jgi:hypothetical protein
MKLSPELSILEITVDHHPMGVTYSMITPTISINGVPEKRKWGTHLFQLPPGYYLVEISYPFLFMPECGKNSVGVTLGPEEIKKVNYRAPMMRLLKGSITVA